jgi:hypothetical protein
LLKKRDEMEAGRITDNPENSGSVSSSKEPDEPVGEQVDGTKGGKNEQDSDSMIFYVDERCAFFVQRKKRNCRMMVKPGKRFCGEHAFHEEIQTGSYHKLLQSCDSFAKRQFPPSTQLCSLKVLPPKILH